MTGAPPDFACATATPPVDEVTEQDFRVSLGLRLRLVRVARRLSQRQLANAAGIHRTVVGSIERGQVNLGIAYLPRLADALGVPASWLLPEPDHPHRCSSAVAEQATPAEPDRTVQDWEIAFIAASVRAPRGPYLPNDLMTVLDAAPLATVETFLRELEARVGEDIPAEEQRAIWDRMASA
jgi:transcriptional regulator with XRE-family HTH domain